MAWVYRVGSRWYAGFLDGTGRQSRKATTARTRTAAERLARELEAKAERQRFGLEQLPPEDGGGPWTELVRWYGKAYIDGGPQEQRWWSSARHHLLSGPLAELRVADVTPDALERLLLERQKTAGLSAQTLNHIRAAVSVVFTRARETGRWRERTRPGWCGSARFRGRCATGSGRTRCRPS